MATERGFTLIEVLVAFVIAAIALGALFQGAAGSLAATATAGRYDEALSRAQSHLAVLGHGVPLRLLRQQGEEADGYRFDLAVTPLGSTPPRAGTLGLGLYAVQVTESWDGPTGPRHITLDTRRIGPAAP